MMKKMEVINMPENTNIMKITDLKSLLSNLEEGLDGSFEVWLSSDEEGNEILPMPQKPELSLSVEAEQNRVIFFPAHC